VLVLHVQFAQTGYFYRYDAYLIGLGIFVLAPFLRELLSIWFAGADFKGRLPAIAVFTILMIFPAMTLGQRAYRALMDIPAAAGNIYQQQYQMARFIRQYYSGSTVALNDIGAVNFMARIDCLDLSGLDDARAFALLRTNQYDADAVSRLAEDRKVRIALIYEELFCRNPGLISVGRPLGLPKTWLRVAEWTISNNVVCGGNTVSFFATSPEEARLLRSNLIEFAPQLPKSVMVTMS
jgi:hypothetical protein